MANGANRSGSSTEPHTGDTPAVPTPRMLTAAQRDQLFQLELRKKQLEVDKEEQELENSQAKVANEQAKLANEQALNDARINALNNAQQPRRNEDDDDAEGEFLIEVKKIALSLPGLPRKAINAIYENKFNPLELYKLRRHTGREREEERPRTIEDINGVIVSKKKGGSLKDFGFVSKIWSAGFLNYVQILMGFSIITYPLLFNALLAFHSRIIELSDIYNWKDTVLPLAIEYYTEITYTTPLDISAWRIPQEWIDKYCTPDKTLYYISTSRPTASRKRSATITIPSEICLRFNGKGCFYKSCDRTHACKECGEISYGALSCLLKKTPP